jgi:hypothetical protein
MSVCLSLIVLRSARMGPMLNFYAALGVELKPEQHGSGPVHLAGRAGGVVLEVYPLAEGCDEERVRLGLTVPDLAVALRALAGEGFPQTGPAPTPWGLRAVVRDPDGRAVELYEAPTEQGN